MNGALKRLAITLLVPALVVLGERYLLVPGVDAPEGVPGVFALGVTPIITAAMIVEIIAFLVPRWARQRHVPKGRAQIERAARILALALATLQAYGVARQLEGLVSASGGGRYPPLGLDVITLVAGVCVMYLAARLVTRHGLVNGYALLLAIQATGDLHASARFFAHEIAAGDVVPSGAAVFTLAVSVFAGWVVLGRPSAPPRPTRTLTKDAAHSPYRGAQTLLVHPWVPLPAGSLQPVVAVIALAGLPSTLAAGGLPPWARSFTRAFEDWGFTVSVFLTALAVFFIWGAARLMNRPRELAELALRLGASAGDVRAAIRSALPTTYLFLFAVACACAVTKLSLVTSALLTAVAIDLYRAGRLAWRRPSFVVVWEERRAPAVPVLRAALAAEGIASEVRGLSFLSLFQVFVPYAPAEILVRAEHAPRATLALRHWLVGDAAPEPEPPNEAKLSFLEKKRPWPTRQRNWVLVACIAAMFALTSVVQSSLGKPAVSKELHRLEVVRIDDTVDVIEHVQDEELPSGVEIVWDQIDGAKAYFAKLAIAKGQPVRAGRERLLAFLTTLAPRLPAGARFALQDVEELDQDTGLRRVVSVRSVVLTGEPVLRTADVADATAQTEAGEGSAYVAITLAPGAAHRFEEATGQWTHRRLAIVVDDVVTSTPIVRTRIGGGRLSITMGAGDPEKTRAEARDLAASLRPRERD